MEIDWSFWKPTIKEALPFGLSGIFIMIYYWIDSVMLSLLQGDTVVGWYNASYRLVLVLAIIPSAILTSLFPLMSRFYESSEKSLRFSYEKSFKYLLIIAVPIGVGMTLLADRIILLVYGSEYTPSIIALQILIWSEVLIFLSIVFGNLLNSINKQIIVTRQTAIAAILNVIMNLLLIPRYSYVGASIATVATECFAFMFLLTHTSKMGYNVANRTSLNTLLKIMTASLLMGSFIWYFKNLNLLILIALSTLIYLVIFYVIGGVDKDDILLAKQIILGKNK